MAVHRARLQRTAACPGAQFVDFAQENKTLGAETLATIPIVDYVAADKNRQGRRGREGAERALGEVGREEAGPRSA